MRYLVTARLKLEREAALREAIADETLGAGSVAEGEYLRDMAQARRLADGRVRWVEVCFCPTPLEEERPYWEEYFELLRFQDAHSRRKCRDASGEEPWACSGCDCTARLEERMAGWGEPFLEALESSLAAQPIPGSDAGPAPRGRRGIAPPGPAYPV